MRRFAISAILALIAACSETPEDPIGKNASVTALPGETASVEPASVAPAHAEWHEAPMLRNGEWRQVRYFLDGPFAIVGDQIVGRHADIQRAAAALQRMREAVPADGEREQILDSAEAMTSPALRPLIIFDPRFRWARRTIPYRVTATDSALVQRIQSAIDAWDALGITNFVPEAEAGAELIAQVGIVTIESGGTNTTFPAERRVRLTQDAPLGTVIHELGHVLGLEHEHKRTGADALRTVDLSNIRETFRSQYNPENDGDEQPGDYDLCSIMHYSEVAGSAWRIDPTKSGRVFTLTDEGRRTLNQCAAQFAEASCRRLGQRCALSTGDIAGIREAYAGVPN